jgi:putative flippase GtrA
MSIINHQFTRFIIVGAANTSFSYSIYALLLFIGQGFRIAGLFSMVFGILISFKMQGKFVFRNPSNRLFWRYIIMWSTIYFVYTSFIGILTSLGLNAYVSGILAYPAALVSSYLFQKKFVFARNGNDEKHY